MTFRLAEVRELREQYSDGRAEPTLDSFPAPRTKKPPRRGRGVPMPRKKLGQAKMAGTGLLRQFLPLRALAKEHPEEIVPHVDQRWWRLAHFDSAIVSSADGMAASWYRRDPRGVPPADRALRRAARPALPAVAAAGRAATARRSPS